MNDLEKLKSMYTPEELAEIENTDIGFLSKNYVTIDRLRVYPNNLIDDALDATLTQSKDQTFDYDIFLQEINKVLDARIGTKLRELSFLYGARLTAVFVNSDLDIKASRLETDDEYAYREFVAKSRQLVENKKQEIRDEKELKKSAKKFSECIYFIKSLDHNSAMFDHLSDSDKEIYFKLIKSAFSER
jgi:hypothetical protein